MREVLVYEHLTATCDRASPLFAEGKAMLEAVLADLQALCVQVQSPKSGPEDLVALAPTVDGVLLIAPETGGVLQRLCGLVENAGGRLLGPSSAAVGLTADKLRLAGRLHEAGVRTPCCGPAGLNGLPYPQICKPRDGAGSQATFLIRRAEDWPDCISEARREGYDGELLAHPFVLGVPASVSFLIGPAGTMPLTPTRQILSDDGRFHYLASAADLLTGLASRATAIASRAIQAVCGLRGYVGVDVVLGEPADGSLDHVIEINPRMTSSYLELRRISKKNLMEEMLQILEEPVETAVATSDRPGDRG